MGFSGAKDAAWVYPLPSCLAVLRMCGETRNGLHIAAKMCYQEDLLGQNIGLLSHLKICLTPSPFCCFILIKQKNKFVL